MRIVILFALAGAIYACAVDQILVRFDERLPSTTRSLIFGAGLVANLSFTVRRLRTRFGFKLRFWHAALACAGVNLVTLTAYRIYCLLVYQESEVQFLSENYDGLLKGVIVLVVLSFVASLLLPK